MHRISDKDGIYNAEKHQHILLYSGRRVCTSRASCSQRRGEARPEEVPFATFTWSTGRTLGRTVGESTIISGYRWRLANVLLLQELATSTVRVERTFKWTFSDRVQLCLGGMGRVEADKVDASLRVIEPGTAVSAITLLI